MRYLFDRYELDTERRELRRDSASVPIAPQVFDLLEHLIRHRERVVTKDELIGAIWGGRVITDSALTTRMNVVRRAIGDDGEQQRLIKTLIRKGFRFVGSLRDEWCKREASPGLSGSPLAAPEHPAIAVLPFVNKSGELRGEFSVDALAEDLLTELARLRWLIVVARNASFTYRQTSVSAGQIGRELGVRYLLEGSVRQIDGRIRVTARLIDARSGVHIWAERCDRAPAEISSARDDMMESMVAAIAVAVIHAERRRAMRKLPGDLDAWEAYQRGMWHMSRGESAENQLAQGFFRRAIELDPNFGPGRHALAWSYMMAASIFSQMTIEEGCGLAEPLAREAVALDEDDAEAHARLAIVALLRGDFQEAYEGAERILAVSACAEAAGVKGAVLVYSGRGEKGRAAIRQHLALSPRDPARPIRLSQIAASLYLEGNYGAAATAAQQVSRQYPKHPVAYRWLAASLGQLGRTAEARQVVDHLRVSAPSSFDMYVRQKPEYCRIEYAPLLAGLRKAGWKD